MRVLRWGRSAYETDEGLAHERRGVEALGLGWAHVVQADAVALPPAEVLVVTSGVRVHEAALRSVGCELVLTTTSGYDHIDLDACSRLGVSVARSPLARRDAVVEHSLGMLIALCRRLPRLEARAVAGVWARGELPELAPVGLSGLPVAVVGLGVIGQQMARALDLLGAHVLGVDPFCSPPGVQVVSFDEALAVAGAVTLHCSLTPSSRDLLHRRRLRALPKGAVVINTARGRSLDVSAAVELVKSGHLGGLGVDVFPEEPWPELASAQHPGVLFSPHASGYTTDLGRRVAEQVHRTVGAWAAGEPLPFPVGVP